MQVGTTKLLLVGDSVTFCSELKKKTKKETKTVSDISQTLTYQQSFLHKRLLIFAMKNVFSLLGEECIFITLPYSSFYKAQNLGWCDINKSLNKWERRDSYSLH